MSIVEEKLTKYPVREVFKKFYPLFRDYTPRIGLAFLFIAGATIFPWSMTQISSICCMTAKRWDTKTIASER